MEKKIEIKSSLFNSFINQIIGLDFTGKKPQLQMGSSHKNKTFLGGFFSLLIFITLLISFLYFGQEIVFKEIPSIVLSSTKDNGSNPILLNSENFHFLFSLKDSNENNIDLDTEYLDIKLNYVTYNNTNSIIGDENNSESSIVKINSIKTNNCKNLDFQTSKYKEELKNLNMSNYKCLADEIEISGSKETNFLSYLDISINSCIDIFDYMYKNNITINDNFYDLFLNKSNSVYNNSELIKFFNKNFNINSTFLSNRKICPLKDITNIKDISDKLSVYNKNKNILKSSTFILKYIDTYFDGRSFRNLANYIVEEYNTKINFHNYKQADLYLKRVEYHTDMGYIFEDFNITFYSKVDNINVLVDFYDETYSNNFQPFLIFRIKGNKLKDKFYRKYYKIQNLVAELGGILKSFFVIALILNYFNNNAKYYEKMINELFDVDDLFKYYQYYNSKNKIIFKKYRDSIFLRNTKTLDNYKKSIGDKHGHSSNLIIKSRTNQSKDNVLEDISHGHVESVK